MEKGRNSEHIKASNIRAMLAVIYKYGPISRTEIAERLGLSAPAITFNITPFISSGLLVETETRELHGKGRPRILLDFNASSCFCIGIDIGPYATYACISDIRGNLVAKVEKPVCPHDYNKAVSHISEVVMGLLSEYSDLNIIGMSIGIPGFVDPENNLVRYAAVSKWRDKHLGDDVSSSTGLPCIIENNARCRALSVEMFGKESIPDTYAFFFVARGICCPVKISDDYYHGVHSAAGEVGHMVVDRNGPICPTCGNHGCLEAISSETSIINHCTLLSSIAKDVSNPQIEEILLAQRDGDREVCRILDNAMYYLGVALANIINFLNPPLVLIDAYMMKSDRNRATLLSAAKDSLFAIDINDVKIKFVEFDKYRTAIGAAATAINHFILKGER